VGEPATMRGGREVSKELACVRPRSAQRNGRRTVPIRAEPAATWSGEMVE
jgi:hypothetical protein